MALKTQGFALSALPRAPQIPNNVGQIDVKEIYDGVRRGLEAFELARQAPQGMALADAQMKAKTLQAPLTTRGLLAQTEAAEQQLPIRTALLASEASPEMQEAKRQALLNRSVRAPSGDIQLATALAAAKTRFAEDPNDAEAAQLVSVLEPMAIRKSAASMSDPRAVIDAGLTKSADANATRVATNDANIASREGIVGQQINARTATSDADRISKETIAAGNVAAKTAATEAKTTADKAKKSVVAKAQLDAINTRADVIERSIAEAVPKINGFTAGFAGSKLSQISGTEATNVRRLLDTVKANIGFEELNNLRAQSVTGGALGNITVEELRFLQSVQGSLEQDQEPAQLKRNLEVILARFRELRAKKQEAFEEEYGIPFNPPTPSASESPPSESSTWDDAKEKRLQELRSKLGK